MRVLSNGISSNLILPYASASVLQNTTAQNLQQSLRTQPINIPNVQGGQPPKAVTVGINIPSSTQSGTYQPSPKLPSTTIFSSPVSVGGHLLQGLFA